MNKSNQNMSFKGNKLKVLGNCLKEGDSLPNFKLTGVDMADIELANFKGKTLIVSVVPSLDTPTCALQTKRFNKEASALSNDVVILTVSMDLPFAQKRWCGAEGVDKVVTASDYKYRGFAESYGVYLQDMGLLARAVFVADKNGTITHLEYVAELSAEPDYEAVLSAVKTSI